jgi:hypothetical protein
MALTSHFRVMSDDIYSCTVTYEQNVDCVIEMLSKYLCNMKVHVVHLYPKHIPIIVIQHHLNEIEGLINSSARIVDDTYTMDFSRASENISNVTRTFRSLSLRISPKSWLQQPLLPLKNSNAELQPGFFAGLRRAFSLANPTETSLSQIA